MTAHKHAEMIKAKADNMDLVVISRRSVGDWRVVDGWPRWFQDREYFLCHPKHEKECLHWLNGGEVQILHSPRHDWEGYNATWCVSCAFMDGEIKIRIKPRKEKRWIAVKYEGHILPVLADSKSSIEQHAASKMVGEFQFIEIEVEV